MPVAATPTAIVVNYTGAQSWTRQRADLPTETLAPVPLAAGVRYQLSWEVSPQTASTTRCYLSVDVDDLGSVPLGPWQSLVAADQPLQSTRDFVVPSTSPAYTLVVVSPPGCDWQLQLNPS